MLGYELFENSDFIFQVLGLCHFWFDAFLELLEGDLNIKSVFDFRSVLIFFFLIYYPGVLGYETIESFFYLWFLLPAFMMFLSHWIHFLKFWFDIYCIIFYGSASSSFQQFILAHISKFLSLNLLKVKVMNHFVTLLFIRSIKLVRRRSLSTWI